MNYTQTHVQWFIVVPLLATGFFVGAVLWAEAGPTRGFQALDTYGKVFTQGWRLWPPVVVFSIWLLSICSVTRFWAWKTAVAALLAPFACVLVLHAMLARSCSC